MTKNKLQWQLKKKEACLFSTQSWRIEFTFSSSHLAFFFFRKNGRMIYFPEQTFAIFSARQHVPNANVCNCAEMAFRCTQDHNNSHWRKREITLDDLLVGYFGSIFSHIYTREGFLTCRFFSELRLIHRISANSTKTWSYVGCLHLYAICIVN